MRAEFARIDSGYPSDIADGEVARLRADVASLQAECEKLRWFVGHDELTGLPNRRLFSSLAPARLSIGAASVVLLLDLNGFKPINDAYGHEAGDRVLQIVAQRLDACVDNGLVARLGGDEFVGVLTRGAAAIASAAWWVPTITALLADLASPMRVAGRRISVTASIGVAPVEESVLIGDLMHRADMAMYEAKIHGLGYTAWDAQLGSVTRIGRTPAQTSVHDVSAAPMTVPQPRSAADVPTIDPYQRDPADITPAGTYQPADPVWVYRHGAWHPGVVESASRRAVMATYRRNAGAGTVVDTMGAECVLARAGADPQLDHMLATRLGPVA